MQCVTAVEAKWLAELGPMFYVLKTHDYTIRDKKSGDAALGREMEMEYENKVKQKDVVLEAKVLPQSRIVTPGRRDIKTPRRRPF